MFRYDPEAHSSVAAGDVFREDLADFVHDSVLAYDTEGRIRYWNQSAERTYGWSRSEIIGRPLSIIQYGSPAGANDDQERDVQTWVDPFKAPNPLWEGEIRHQHRNGSMLVFQSRQVRCLDDEGNPSHVLSFNRDITVHRALEIKLLARSNELERSIAELESFARIASHDLREPLRMIGSFARLLDRRYRDRLDEPGGEFLDYVIAGAERMSIMIRDLLNVARVGSAPVQMQTLDLNDLLRDVTNDLSLAIADSDASVIARTLPVVQGDKTQLHRVFQNLLENAIKFSGADTPVIEISAEQLSGIWRISISDNGPGISQFDLNRIFLPNTRGSQSAAISGSGTGLAVTRTIIRAHGGGIWAESAEGQGATFHFTLPIGGTENQ